MATNKKILLAFYGDDFTGSTDALEFICRAGAKAILFIEPPTAEQLNNYPSLDAYGVAGKTRSLSPVEMEKILLPAFETMKASGARHVHYKVCSTFDSTPLIGSIGKAIDCGFDVFDHVTVPVLGGMPALGRYCLFGNLFAKMGIGSEGEIFRLDRHPSMSHHPVTPANESDLCIHLSHQTGKEMKLVNILELESAKTIEKAVNKFLAGMGKPVILLDAVKELDLLNAGEYLDEYLSLDSEQALFSVGSSAVELALGSYWNKIGLLKRTTTWQKIKKANPLLVVSGSCSPVTVAQMAHAKSNGFEEVILDAIKICDDEIIDHSVIEKVNTLLQQQKNVIVHTGAKQTNNLSSEKLGTALGQIAKAAAEKALVKRIVIAGGDTSSYAARAMEIDAVEMIAPLVSGAPLCKAISKNNFINGVEVNFKGGQVGSEKYFEVLLNGSL
ncbi:four-carbon acid sugar kinase family protein [Ferruginibacter sp.]|nr:four-carbon acid sugar kinase family protein [Ferruginibacter sp.]